MLKILKTFFIIGIIFGSIAVGSIWYLVNNYHVDFSRLANYNPGHPSILLDDQGNEWGRFQLDRREPISLDAMPKHVINAFIAAEDWQFFSHYGISIKGIIRSSLVNLSHFRIVQGASTITQQLIKLLFTDSKRTFSRKIKEQIFALLVEQQFSKQQILETYLNHVYFGCGIYGVQAASQRFWSKSVAALTIDEAAALAGIVRNPAKYCPLLYPASCKKRRNIILNSMHKLDAITDKEYDQAKAKSLILAPADAGVCAPHLKEALRMQLEDTFGKEMLYSGGLIIQTTISRAMQDTANKSFQDQIVIMKKTIMKEIDGALITMQVKTGEIKALIGGAEFAKSKFNRALQAKRQMGSIFKPLIYAQAMKAGYTFADTEIDEPIDIDQYGALWQPQNYNDEFDGQVTLAHALAHSNNIVPIKLLLKIGIDPVVALAKKCHLGGEIPPYPSLALGCVDATVKEAIGMFNIFANGGVYVQPHAIKWVKDRWGTKIYKEPVLQERILDTLTTGKVVKTLELSFNRLRSMFNQQFLDGAILCKTGTTNDSRTCWFAGSSPEYTTVVYVGCDDNRPMGKTIFPSKTAFPIWLGLHTKITDGKRSFTYDPALRMITIDRYTGNRVPADHPNAIEIGI